jgi:heptosyltransferase-2
VRSPHGTATVVRSLVIAPQWLGDCVMAEPLLRRLAARGERVTVAALPHLADVFAAMPPVAQVLPLPFAKGRLELGARRSLASQMNGQFDVAYVLPNSLKSALLPFLAGIPRRVGYLGEARVGLLTHRLRNPAKGSRSPMVPFYSALSGETDIEADRPQLVVQAAARDATLAAFGLKGGDYMALVPGSDYGPAKRWPAQHYAALAWQAAGAGRRAVLLGSSGEAALGESIVAESGGACLSLAGQTTLAQALHLIAGAAAVVSNDSGLMHVAAALGRPQVALFGSSSPEHTPPLNDMAQVVWLKRDPAYQPPLDCAPCFERECRFGHTRCLGDVSAERVAHLLPT